MTAALLTRDVQDAPEVRRLSRLLAVLVVPVGPAAVAALRFVLPYETDDSTRQAVSAVQAHPGTQSAVVWLGMVAVLTMVPGVLWVARLARHRSPRLTAAAVLLLVPGYLSLSMLVGTDAALWFGVTHHLPSVVLGDMYDGLHPAMVVTGLLFVLGHVLGTVLLGAALWRSRAVPRWAAACVVAAQPVHVVAAVVLGSHALDLVGWGLNAVGFAVAASVIARTDDEAWDLGAVTRE
jgi:hypothetical protein